MKNYLVGIGAVVAITVTLFQGPRIDSAEQVSAMSVKGAACNYDGYVDTNCSDLDANCSAGTSQTGLLNINQNGSHKTVAGLYSNGNCTGNSNCPTGVNTVKLTTTGCSS